MSTHPQRYEILLVPEHVTDDEGDSQAPLASLAESAIRSAVVRATGVYGASGYPRYVGEGVEADIDPVTRAVEAILVDGAELDYGLSVRVVAASDD